MTTKYNIDDIIEVDTEKEKFKGVISMITINRKGIRYRAYGERTRKETNFTLIKVQKDFWEDNIKGAKKSE